jgi:hypothetical protein
MARQKRWPTNQLRGGSRDPEPNPQDGERRGEGLPGPAQWEDKDVAETAEREAEEVVYNVRAEDRGQPAAVEAGPGGGPGAAGAEGAEPVAVAADKAGEGVAAGAGDLQGQPRAVVAPAVTITLICNKWVRQGRLVSSPASCTRARAILSRPTPRCSPLAAAG